MPAADYSCFEGFFKASLGQAVSSQQSCLAFFVVCYPMPVRKTQDCERASDNGKRATKKYKRIAASGRQKILEQFPIFVSILIILLHDP
jgi:hypothetical protein